MFELQILEIADRDHVVILLADPEVQANLADHSRLTLPYS